MSSDLMNVRLDSARRRKVRLLRERGVAFSDIVRDAIDQRFAALAHAPLDAQALIEQIYQRFPDPPGLPPSTADPHDRRSARRAIRRKLRQHR